MADSIADNIRIHIISTYSPENSDPQRGMWYFFYQVKIANHADQPVRLISRHWKITNAEGVVSEVNGPGVVGKQPHIMPGESFHYTSACPLDSPFGSMHGNYTMISDSGTIFDAKVPSFTLSKPHAVN